MKKINIIGSVFGQSGYDAHTKGLALGLHEIGVDVRIECSKVDGWQQLCDPEIFNMIDKPLTDDYVTVAITTPPFWDIYKNGNVNDFYGFCVWEGSHVPKYWLKHINNNKVLVPSMHVLNSITKDMKSLTYNPINIVPHGVDHSVFFPKKVERSDKFTFIANKGWRGTSDDRGGMQYLIKAYAEEFTKKDNVEMRVKINTAYNPNINIQQSLNSLDIKNKSRPDLLINTDQLTQQQLCDFYNMGDVFVCTSMAEGFNLPGIEAMACGLGNIQTYFGGQDEYCDEGNSILITEGEMITPDDKAHENNTWFKPDIKAIRRALRYAYDNPIEIKEMGNNALKTASEFTWRNSAKALMSAIQ